MNKPSIPKGTRDFGPTEMLRRNYIFNTIRSVYALYGFLPIETPATENLSTLTGKYGEEGDRLLFRILNSGDYLGKLTPQERSQGTSAQLAPKLCDRGLRYDLTVPFARFVVMHREELSFPFKRYQIQPVWRADRPQKGRYREFYQCDADTIGTESLWAEVELVHILDEVFRRLGIRTVLHLNNRKILSGITEVCGVPDKLTDLTIAIDKLDKIGPQGVAQELSDRGFDAATVQQIQTILDLPQASPQARLDYLEQKLASSPTGLKGIQELRFVLDRLPKPAADTNAENAPSAPGALPANTESVPSDVAGMQMQVHFDPSLARGLDYYTGAIFEVKALDVPMGSISGGGRYDNLTGIFGLPGLSGVGISFGADRIYDVLAALDKFPSNKQQVRVLFANFGQEEAAALYPVVQQLRREGVCCELYPDAAKIKKQMAYADSLGCSHVVLAGSRELAENRLSLKDMNTGAQQEYTPQDLVKALVQAASRR